MHAARPFIPLFIILCLLLVPCIGMAAEVSGTLGPDTNTQAGLSGNTQVSGTAYFANGVPCSSDSDCYSGHCASDFDGNGAWCAPATSCAHNGTIYANGSSLCYGTTTKETCINGSWVAEICPGSCENGVCVSATVTPTPTPSPGVSGGPGGGAVSGATPTPTPEEKPPVKEEIIFHSTQTYQPTKEELEELLKEAGFSQEDIDKASEQAENIEITKELEVKREVTEKGEERYRSTFKVRIYNRSSDRFRDITIVESIPKSVAEHASEIHSLSDFRVLVEDPVIAWDVKSLEPNQVLVLEYWVEKQLSKDALNEVKTVFFAEKTEIVKEVAGSLEITIKDVEGNLVKEPLTVELLDLEEKVIAKTTSIGGKATFENVLEGRYYIRIPATDAFKGVKIPVRIMAEETKTIEVVLEGKAVPTPTATPTATPTTTPAKPPKKDYAPLFILLALVILAVIAHYGWKKKGVKLEEEKPAKPKKGRWAVEEAEEKVEEKPEEKPAEAIEKPKEEVKEEVVKKRRRRESKFRRP